MNSINEMLVSASYFFGIVGSLTFAGWCAAVYLNRKFNEVHDNIDEKTNSLEKNIIQKLEYHERHDDTRFSEIRDAVWKIRIRNAAQDGVQSPNV